MIRASQGVGRCWQHKLHSSWSRGLGAPHCPTQVNQAGAFPRPVGLSLPSSWDPYVQAA